MEAYYICVCLDPGPFNPDEAAYVSCKYVCSVDNLIKYKHNSIVLHCRIDIWYWARNHDMCGDTEESRSKGLYWLGFESQEFHHRA